MDKRRFDGLRERTPGLHRFLTSDDKPYPVVREVLVGALLVLLVLGTLWGYTGQPIGRSPVVVVESGSMMHCKNGIPQYGVDCNPARYGRIGFIDPGDLILVKDIDGQGDVAAHGAGGNHHYGRSGEVIIFKPDGREGTPIIHRALFWIEIHGDGTYSVPDYNLQRVDRLAPAGSATAQDRALAELQAACACPGLESHLEHINAGPQDSGFITRGDNNGAADQGSQRFTYPVKAAWILGVARGEIPWLGLVKLLANDLMTGTQNFAQAGNDSKVLLFVTLGVLLGGPVVVEKVRSSRREQRELDENGPAGPT